jgi:hypothetical protein
MAHDIERKQHAFAQRGCRAEDKRRVHGEIIDIELRKKSEATRVDADDRFAVINKSSCLRDERAVATNNDREVERNCDIVLKMRAIITRVKLSDCGMRRDNRSHNICDARGFVA